MSDYISREEAEKAAIDAADEWDGGCNLNRWRIIKKGIRAIPAADVRPVAVARLEYRHTKNGDGLFCTNCGELWTARKIGKYCYNCGADMSEYFTERKNYDFLMRVSPKLLIYDDTNINIGKKNFTESGKLHTIDKECARRYLEGKIFFGFIIDAFNRIINRINEIEDVINQK